MTNEIFLPLGKFALTKSERTSQSVQDKLINNYFKSHEEMEADFSHIYTQSLISLSFSQNIDNKDGYDIHSPEMMNQGFMEENY